MAGPRHDGRPLGRAGLLALLALPALFALAACDRGPALGRSIYFDGVGRDGTLAYSQGPDWLRFTTANCVVCHGERGRGLTVQAAGITGVAPAVTWPALVERGYDEPSLRRALTQGVDPHGREFHYYMPRWVLADEELDALVAWLQRL